MVRTAEGLVLQRDHEAVGDRLLLVGVHVIKIEGRLVPHVGPWDPSELTVGDHHVRPSGSTLFRTSPLRHVLASPYGEDALPRVKVRTDMLVTHIEEFSKSRQASRIGVRRSRPSASERLPSWGALGLRHD
jgi:hypothetical protein